MLDWIVSTDINIIRFFIDNLKNPVLDVIMHIITLFGEKGAFWIVCSLICLAFPRTRKMGLTIGLALIFGVVIGNGILKNVVMRPRPYTLDQFADIFKATGFPELSDWSFPSGHSLASFEAAVSIMFYHKKWGIAALVLAFCVAISRIYLIVHFPTDVLCGAILGTVFAVTAYFVVKALYKRFDLESKLLFPYEKRSKEKKAE